MNKVKAVFLGILVAVLILFAYFNSHSVEVRVFGKKHFFESPLWAVVYVTVAIGAIIGLLLRSHGKKDKYPRQ
jgi:uncharacterized integral membrane protein